MKFTVGNSVGLSGKEYRMIDPLEVSFTTRESSKMSPVVDCGTPPHEVNVPVAPSEITTTVGWASPAPA
ncbi:MAG: hypothetical protein GWN18_13830 [Thermoplasmata archaeon]|nr:hypothetical protein [Thermoplasmata archaeon]NIW83603.1 hypothetical protein [Thermoplasmata archaeon]NIW89853.1 hypothetical protein [Thermoplasmata archaeon]